MAETDKPAQQYYKDFSNQLTDISRVARNTVMLYVMEPPHKPSSDVEKARETIAFEASNYLNDVEEGIKSPYFIPYTSQDARFIGQVVAVQEILQSVWDPYGVFVMGGELSLIHI